MLKYGNKEFRNLEEQVRKNQEDIANHYAQDRVLADFGIKVVGQVDTPEDLPDAATYIGEYGNAYAVGTEAPYIYYIWTRANNISPTDYWFDFGEITIIGPQGRPGKTVIGPAGERGGIWYTGNTIPASVTPIKGDMWLKPDDSVYAYNGSAWVYITNIKGSIGATGPQGNNAGTITIGEIKGIAPSLEVLATIDPTTVPAGSAYFVGQAMPYAVYMPIEGMWQNVGTFNAGSIVTTGGSYVAEFDADTKVDVMLPTNNEQYTPFVYVQGANGKAYRKTISINAPTSKTIPCYDDAGTLCTNDPVVELDCANKRYVDTALTSAGRQLYSHRIIIETINDYNLAFRVLGTIINGDPTDYTRTWFPGDTDTPPTEEDFPYLDAKTLLAVYIGPGPYPDNNMMPDGIGVVWVNDNGFIVEDNYGNSEMYFFANVIDIYESEASDGLQVIDTVAPWPAM